MAAKRLYIGNLPFDINRQELEDFLAPRKVLDVKLITDRETGRPRGFGFVEMESEKDAASAVFELNGAELGGRTIVVSEAREPGNRGGESGGRKNHHDNRKSNRRERRDY